MLIEGPDSPPMSRVHDSQHSLRFSEEPVPLAGTIETTLHRDGTISRLA
jgi:hypothetical protein